MKSINRILSIVLTIVILAGSIVAPAPVLAKDYPTSYGEWEDISEYPDLVMGTDTNVFTIAGDGTTMFMWTKVSTALAEDAPIGDTSIYVGSTEGFPATGTIRLNGGPDMTYTSKDDRVFNLSTGILSAYIAAPPPTGSRFGVKVEAGSTIIAAALYKSTDAGLTWSANGLSAPIIPLYNSLNTLKVCPTDSQKLIASDGYRLYISVNGGQDWSTGITASTLISGSTSIRAIDIAASADGAAIIAGTDKGVAVFDPGQASWNAFVIGSVYAAAFCPNYMEQSQVLVLVNDGINTWLWTKVGANAWNADVEKTTLLSNNISSIGFISTACLAFPSDYNWRTTNQVFVGIDDKPGLGGDVYRINGAQTGGTPSVTDCNLGLDVASLAVAGSKSDSTVIASQTSTGITISIDADTTSNPTWSNFGIKNPYYSFIGNPPVLQLASNGLLYAGVYGNYTSFYKATPDFKSFNGISRTEVTNIYRCSFQTHGYLFDYYLPNDNGNTMFFYKTAEENWEMRLSAIDTSPGFMVRPTGIWHSNIVYTVLNKNKRIVYKSTDAGLTWNQDKTFSQDIAELGVISNDEYYVYYSGQIQSNKEGALPLTLPITQTPVLIASAGTGGILVGCNKNSNRVPKTWLYSSDGNTFSILGVQDQWDDTILAYNYVTKEEMLKRDGYIGPEVIYVLKNNGFLYRWVLNSSTEWEAQPLNSIPDEDISSVSYVDVVGGVTFISLKKAGVTQLYRALPKKNGKLDFRPYLGSSSTDIGGQIKQFSIWKNQDESFRFQAFLSDFPQPYPSSGTANYTKRFTFTDFYGPPKLKTADDAEFNNDASLEWEASQSSIPVEYKYEVSHDVNFETVISGDFSEGTNVTLSKDELSPLIVSQAKIATLNDSLDSFVEENDQTYYWRVCVDDDNEAQHRLNSLWSETRSFNIVNATAGNPSPSSGPVGTNVTISGTGAALEEISIRFPTAAAADEVDNQIVDPTTLAWSSTFTIPEATAGNHNIYVYSVTAGALVTQKTFRIVPSITLNKSSAAAGTAVTISGKGFQSSDASISVLFDSTNVITVASNTNGSFSGTFIVPAVASGAHTVTAADTASTPNTASANLNTISNAAIVLNKTSGKVGSSLVVAGTGFVGGESGIVVTYDGNPVGASITATGTGSWSLSFNIPASAGGTHSVHASGGLTRTSEVTAKTFTVTPNLSINTNSGPPSAQIILTGTGFAGNETGIIVTWDNEPVGNSGNAGSTGAWTSTIIVPVAIPGVHNICAYGSTTLVDSVPTLSFNVIVEAPTVGNISPSSGSLSGGTPVTITGTGFVSNDTTVTIGGAAATNVVVVDDTTISATTPTGTVGEQDVVVTTPGGFATLADGFTYVLGGFTLSSGWNLLSTPFTLDSSKNMLSQIFDPESLSNINIVYGWSQGHWTQISSDFVLEPLTAIYVEVKAGKTVSGILVPSSEISAPPSRQLDAGLNLVGPAPAYQNGVLQTQTISQALVSIAQAEGGLPGYIMVVSPAHNQTGWTYALGSQTYSLQTFKGYWVVMDNPDTLYGFSTTPLVSGTTPTPTGLALTWDQALLPENRNRQATVTGRVVEVVPGWTTHLLVVMGAPYGEGFEAELFDPTLTTWPGVTGSDISDFQAAWVGKNVEVTGKIIVSDKMSSLGKTRLYMLETDKIKIVP